MMTPTRKFTIKKAGEPKSLWRDAWTTKKDLEKLGIEISISILYRIKQNETKTVAEGVTVTCER